MKLHRCLIDMPFGALSSKFPASPRVDALPVPATYAKCTKNGLAETQASAARASR
jgi:hypothetical protein